MSKSKLIQDLKTLLSGYAPPKQYNFMAEGVTKEGVKVITEAPEFTEGVEVFVEIDGVVQAAPNGQHELEDGTVIEVAEGKIVTITKAEVTDDTDLETLKTEIETTLKAVDKDRQDFATQLSAANAELVALQAEKAEAIKTRDAEIVNLKAEVTTLKSQVKSVRDGGGQSAEPAKETVKLREDGKPLNWSKMNDKQRFDWNIENLNFKQNTVN